jgi:plastocyanin
VNPWLCLCLAWAVPPANQHPSHALPRCVAPGHKEPSPAGAALEGTVTYSGPIPKPVAVAEADTVRHRVELDPKTKGLKDAVVWLEGAKAPAKRGRPKPAVMDQQNFFFVPHVLAVEAGQEVQFLNSDAANHGVIASSADRKNEFNVVTPPGQSHRHRFVASKRPVRIGCPLHAGMGAWVAVFDHPYYGVTDREGQFRLPPVPPGEYTLRVEHLDTGAKYSRKVRVKDGEPARLAVRLDKKDEKG